MLAGEGVTVCLLGRKFETHHININCFTARTAPYRITFKTNADEATAAIALNADANEQDLIPSGFVGFSLSYAQVAC